MLSKESLAALQAVLATRQGGQPISASQLQPADAATAYAIQDATAQALGAVGGWKVGARNLQATPTCAPLPASGLLPSGARLSGPAWRLRGIEVEVALRLARDITPDGPPITQADWPGYFDAVLPVIEVVESRFEDRKAATPLGQLADLQSHGALILGTPQPLDATRLNLLEIDARLEISGQAPMQTHGANPAPDLWWLLSWLFDHCRQQGRTLRAGQIITTGSCTGMPLAPAGATVQGAIDGLGAVSLSFQ